MREQDKDFEGRLLNVPKKVRRKRIEVFRGEDKPTTKANIIQLSNTSVDDTTHEEMMITMRAKRHAETDQFESPVKRRHTTSSDSESNNSSYKDTNDSVRNEDDEHILPYSATLQLRVLTSGLNDIQSTNTNAEPNSSRIIP